MNKLEKFLSTQCNQYQESVTTLSKYYKIGNCRIRVSDHFSISTDVDLSIITSLNKSKKYIVSAGGKSDCYTCYLWNANEIIDFIPYLVSFCNLKERHSISPNPDVKDLKIIKIKSKYSGRKNPPVIGAVVCHSNSDFWKEEDVVILSGLISNELNGLKVDFTNQFKDFLKAHSCSYQKVLNLYKCLYVDNNIPVTSELMVRILNQL